MFSDIVSVTRDLLGHTWFVAGIVILLVWLSLRGIRERFRRRRLVRWRTAEQEFSGRLQVLLSALDSPSVTVRIDAAEQMAFLADGWADGRQRVVTALCRSLAVPDSRLLAEQWLEVRRRTLLVLVDRLERGDWPGLEYDFSESDLSRASLAGAKWHGGKVSFAGSLVGGLDLGGSSFNGVVVDFRRIDPGQGRLSLDRMRLTNGSVMSFASISVPAAVEVSLARAEVADSTLDFEEMNLRGGTIDARNAKIGGSSVLNFSDLEMGSGTILFDHATINGDSGFRSPRSPDSRQPSGRSHTVSACQVGTTQDLGISSATEVLSFANARLRGGNISFEHSFLEDGILCFRSANLHGARISFDHARLEGATLDFKFLKMDFGRITFRESRISDGFADYGKSHPLSSWLALKPEELKSLLFCVQELPRGALRFWDARLEQGAILFDEAYLDQSTLYFVGCVFGQTKLRFNKTRSDRPWLVTWRASYESGYSEADFSGIQGGIYHLTCRDDGEDWMRDHGRFPRDTKAFVISSFD